MKMSLKCLTFSMLTILTCIPFVASNTNAIERTEVSGTVTYNGTPVTAMVLANGKYMFTGGGEGRFELFDVPFDSNGEITLYGFCSGLSPYKATLSEGVTDYEIELTADAGAQQPVVSVTSLEESSTKTGWIDISGTIENDSELPLCAMVLANGQYMFTCSDPKGEFNLTVPLDSNGEITLYGFCSGFLPYKEIIIVDYNSNNIDNGSGDSTDGSGQSSDATYIYHEDTSDYTWNSSDEVVISLNGDTITMGGDIGAGIDGSTVTITSAGTYRFSGTLDDGQIVVDTEDEAAVRLILDGVDIYNSISAPIYVANAEKTIIGLAEGSDNYITDPATYVFEDSEDDEPNAAIFSKDDLTIFGCGTLSVYANYNDGIASKDGLVLRSGTIFVDNVADDGIRGKDYLVVKDATITVNAVGDGLKSDNEEDAEKGIIDVYGGVITVVAEKDGLQAETDVIISGGEIDITSGGGSSVVLNQNSDSAKGVKGGVSVTIDGGTFNIDSADDAVHSNDSIAINDGIFNVASGDDGFHADTNLEINDGDFSITDSYEGIESAVITIAGGNFFINSDDDGLNCAGGNDGSGMNGPGGGRDGFNPPSSGDYYLYIEGGYLAIYSNGDSLDSNGSIEMSGGTVLVHAPSNDNGALDIGRSCNINGGFLVTAGGPGMGESPSASSSQNFKKLTFSQRSAGTLIHIESSGGTDLVTFEPAKKYSVFIISSPDLLSGTTYNVYFGGSYSGGTENDGLYEGGTYSGGTKDSSLSFSL